MAESARQESWYLWPYRPVGSGSGPELRRNRALMDPGHKEHEMNRATDKNRIDLQDEAARLASDRRQFIKTASKLAVTAPAVSLLLAANAMPGRAYAMYTLEDDEEGSGAQKTRPPKKNKKTKK